MSERPDGHCVMPGWWRIGRYHVRLYGAHGGAFRARGHWVVSEVEVVKSTADKSRRFNTLREARQWIAEGGEL